MRLSLSGAIICLFSSTSSSSNAFQILPKQSSYHHVTTTRLFSVKEEATKESSSTPAKKKKKVLGLLTFDLDDTLYPIETVLHEANTAFASAMIKYGFDGIGPSDIVNTCRKIREEISEKEGPEAGMVLTHTEIRQLAIRKEMETTILKRKLKETADDWATPVSSLSPLIVNHAKKWASGAVSSSVVQAVMNSWEMERHHAAERNLYPECTDVFEQIRKDHPGLIIGAVTDGKANPLFMTFTLAKYFDFSMSWEDDQSGRRNFFKELSSVEGNAELKWIYKAALEKYHELDDANAELKAAATTTSSDDGDNDEDDVEKVWIHVGDDLAYDVGGSAQCGAKTILVELDESKYHQTARFRFDPSREQPMWSTTSEEELSARKTMNEVAEKQIDKRIEFLTLLPEAINEILNDE